MLTFDGPDHLLVLNQRGAQHREGRFPGRVGWMGRHSAATRSHRLVAQDTTLSRWRHGFEPRWDCQFRGQVRGLFSSSGLATSGSCPSIPVVSEEVEVSPAQASRLLGPRVSMSTGCYRRGCFQPGSCPTGRGALPTLGHLRVSQIILTILTESIAQDGPVTCDVRSLEIPRCDDKTRK